MTRVATCMVISLEIAGFCGCKVWKSTMGDIHRHKRCSQVLHLFLTMGIGSTRALK